MIETRARVVAVEPGYAWIECERRSACSHCSESGHCSVAVLGGLFGVRRQRLRLPDPLGVRPDTEVVIGLPERRLLAAAAAAYLLPLLVMIALSLLAARLGFGEGPLAVAAGAGLAAGLWLAQRRANRRGDTGNCQPELLRVQPAGTGMTEFEPAIKGANHE